VPEPELYQVFNMGIGMIAVVPEDATSRVLKFVATHGYKAWPIGEVVKGRGRAFVTADPRT
jgi:phosphoribosylformylglycinamidine cyclo-ligase